jgi:hypothetical protein
MRIVLCVLSLSAAYGQVNRTIMARGEEIMITFQRMTQGFMRSVTGAAYSGDLMNQHTQTLGDGTIITDPPGSQHQVRDRQGRMRIEFPLLIPGSGPKGWEPSLTQISDPVAGFLYLLDDQNKIVHRVKLNEIPKNDGRRKATAVENRVVKDKENRETRTENLGEKMIEGVMAQGVRYSTTHPAGTQNNDRPIMTTQETWFSEELQEVVYQKFTNPRNGETIQRLDKIDRSEPNPLLFQPPLDYKVVDEESSFTITLRRPRG